MIGQESIAGAAPVLKWAGGKTQLLPIINENLPQELLDGKIDTFIEPFFGGGAVFFDLIKKYEFKKAVIIDVNRELVVLYKTIKNDVDSLVKSLASIQEEYLALDEDGRKSYYYAVRERFNEELEKFDFDNYSPKSWVARASQVMFLNRTCFNGLFRVNKKGFFNVPQGKYKNPLILNQPKLEATSRALSNVEIIRGDFEQAEKFVNDKAFIYYDPPYRPLNITSSFNSYADSGFNDDDQRRLGEFYKKMHGLGAKQILSNSDPKNTNSEDNFFDDIFKGFDIQRVAASRRINSNASKRGDITEILVRNY
jgi:DNA adenine methylase